MTTFTAGDKVQHDGTIGIVQEVTETEEGVYELYVNVDGSAAYFPADETEHVA